MASRRKAPNSIWLPESMWGTQLPRDLSPDGWPSCRLTTHLCWAASLSLKLEAMDFLEGPVVMHTPCNVGYAGSILSQGAKILQTSWQLNLCASTTEAVLESPCSAMRRPCATTKTQSSQTKELKSENGERGRPASAGLGTSPRCLRGHTCTYYCQPYPGVSECVHSGAPGRGGRGWYLPLRHLSTCLGATVRRNGTSACGSRQLPNGAHPAGEAETSARRQRPTKDRREAAEDGSLNPLTGARAATPKIRLRL